MIRRCYRNIHHFPRHHQHSYINNNHPCHYSLSKIFRIRSSQWTNIVCVNGNNRGINGIVGRANSTINNKNKNRRVTGIISTSSFSSLLLMPFSSSFLLKPSSSSSLLLNATFHSHRCYLHNNSNNKNKNGTNNNKGMETYKGIVNNNNDSIYNKNATNNNSNDNGDGKENNPFKIIAAMVVITAAATVATTVSMSSQFQKRRRKKSRPAPPPPLRWGRSVPKSVDSFIINMTRQQRQRDYSTQLSSSSSSSLSSSISSSSSSSPSTPIDVDVKLVNSNGEMNQGKDGKMMNKIKKKDNHDHDNNNNDKDCPLCRKYSKGPCGILFQNWHGQCIPDSQYDKKSSSNTDKSKDSSALLTCDELVAKLDQCWKENSLFYDSISLYDDDDNDEVSTTTVKSDNNIKIKITPTLKDEWEIFVNDLEGKLLPLSSLSSSLSLVSSFSSSSSSSTAIENIPNNCNNKNNDNSNNNNNNNKTNKMIPCLNFPSGMEPIMEIRRRSSTGDAMGIVAYLPEVTITIPKGTINKRNNNDTRNGGPPRIIDMTLLAAYVKDGKGRLLAAGSLDDLSPSSDDDDDDENELIAVERRRRVLRFEMINDASSDVDYIVAKALYGRLEYNEDGDGSEDANGSNNVDFVVLERVEHLPS